MIAPVWWRPAGIHRPTAESILLGPAVMYGSTGAYAIGVSHLLGLGCPFRDLTGLDCPGCGATRALASLMHGHMIDALDHNAAAVLIGAVVALYCGLAALGWRVPDRVRSSAIGRHRFLAFASVVLAWTVIRNLPGFSWFGSGLSSVT